MEQGDTAGNAATAGADDQPDLDEAAWGLAAPAAAAPATGTSKTMELLLDVELPVSVCFGRARMPLEEVLKLSPGSVVELSRSVAEPVELIVNNHVVALGEVVVIDGNYGVRIDRIASRQERLSSSRELLGPGGAQKT